MKTRKLFEQNLYDAAKARFKENYITSNTCIRKEEMLQINNLSFHLKKIYKEEQNKPKTRRKDIINSRAENDYMENRKTIQKNQ